ncbi:hypothetical protein VFPBJ_11736 [Purpureocillium lilacinum]|uniref:Uncharacterized protein n=1 Tax=Purpureocillium lilacinum TaxID=33203 RepID=A0A179EWY7_PURLI|nr:hypothetical protein VFPBJ_11736 [Purpureocillium lilacinum]
MNTRSPQSTQNRLREGTFQISGGMTHSQPAAPVINHRSAYLNSLWDSSCVLKDPARHHRVAPGGQTYQADQYAGAQIHAARASVQVQQPAPDFTHGASVPQEYTVIGQQANVTYGNTDCGNLGDQRCDFWEPWMGNQEEGRQISVPRPENESVLHTRGPRRFSVEQIYHSQRQQQDVSALFETISGVYGLSFPHGGVSPRCIAQRHKYVMHPIILYSSPSVSKHGRTPESRAGGPWHGFLA